MSKSDLEAPGGDRLSDLAAPGGNVKLRYVWVAEQIEAEIESGKLAPGARLRAERELAEHYRVAYGTLRHAVDILRVRGLIVTIHGRGTFVAHEPPPFDSRPDDEEVP
jgi:GntR family transcriptional regulator